LFEGWKVKKFKLCSAMWGKKKWKVCTADGKAIEKFITKIAANNFMKKERKNYYQKLVVLPL